MPDAPPTDPGFPRAYQRLAKLETQLAEQRLVIGTLVRAFGTLLLLQMLWLACLAYVTYIAWR